MSKKISVLIAAYNEEKRVGNVLRDVLKYPRISEIVVVDDGSVDKTSEVVNSIKNERINLITLKKNGGKAGAIKVGMKRVKGDYVLLLDADLLNITKRDLDALILPVLDGKVDISISIRPNSPLICKIMDCEFISGERFMKRKILLDVFDKEIGGYGIEFAMNKRILEKGYSFIFVRVSYEQAMKAKKIGFWKGNLDEFKMVSEIVKANKISIFAFFGQFFKMSLISSKYKKKKGLSR